MPALKHDIYIEKGATFRLSMIYKHRDTKLPVDLTNWNARMYISTAYTSTTPAVALSSTTSPGGITLGGVAGTIDVVIDSSATSALTIVGSGVYDLELYDNLTTPPEVDRLLQGKVIISEEVTKE